MYLWLCWATSWLFLFPCFPWGCLLDFPSSFLKAPFQSPLWVIFLWSSLKCRLFLQDSFPLSSTWHTPWMIPSTPGFDDHLQADDTHIHIDNPDFSPENQINVSTLPLVGPGFISKSAWLTLNLFFFFPSTPTSSTFRVLFNYFSCLKQNSIVFYIFHDQAVGCLWALSILSYLVPTWPLD